MAIQALLNNSTDKLLTSHFLVSLLTEYLTML